MIGPLQIFCSVLEHKYNNVPEAAELWRVLVPVIAVPTGIRDGATYPSDVYNKKRGLLLSLLSDCNEIITFKG
jgi:hypothetical protein